MYLIEEEEIESLVKEKTKNDEKAGIEGYIQIFNTGQSDNAESNAIVNDDLSQSFWDVPIPSLVNQFIQSEVIQNPPPQIFEQTHHNQIDQNINKKQNQGETNRLQLKQYQHKKIGFQQIKIQKTQFMKDFKENLKSKQQNQLFSDSSDSQNSQDSFTPNNQRIKKNEKKLRQKMKDINKNSYEQIHTLLCKVQQLKTIIKRLNPHMRKSKHMLQRIIKDSEAVPIILKLYTSKTYKRLFLLRRSADSSQKISNFKAFNGMIKKMLS